MTKKEFCKLAKDYHDQGLNCAQSLLMAYREKTGLDEKQSCGIGSGFGGGVRCGGICGAISAPVMVLGMLYPHTPDNGMAGKQRATQLTKEFERRFKERFGYLNCRELLAVKDLDGTDMARELQVEDHCGVLIVSAADMLFDMLEELEGE